MNYQKLPNGYVKFRVISLQSDKRLALGVNALAVGLAVVMILIGCLIQPLFGMFSLTMRSVLYWALTLVGVVVYMLLHELIHGIFMRALSGVKPRYGFTGLYAYAGSSAFFDKRAYLAISLAPILILGLALAAMNCFLPARLFWYIFFIQIMNVSGAAGDLYVSTQLAKLPGDTLICDAGVSMSFYSRTPDTEA